jgi:hypothetical protein
MTYACPAWEFAADSLIVKLQRLQSKVLHTISNFSRHTPVRELHVAFKLPYIYDYITKLCRQQADVIQNHENAVFAILDKTKHDRRNIRGLNFAAVKHTTVQVTKLLL